MKHKSYTPEHSQNNPIKSHILIENLEISEDIDIKDFVLFDDWDYKFNNSNGRYTLVQNWLNIIDDADGISKINDHWCYKIVKWGKTLFLKNWKIIDSGKNLRISEDGNRHIITQEENWVEYDLLKEWDKVIFKTISSGKWLAEFLDGNIGYKTSSDTHKDIRHLLTKSVQTQIWVNDDKTLNNNSDENNYWYVEIAQAYRVNSYFGKFFSTRDGKIGSLFMKDNSSWKYKNIYQCDSQIEMTSENTFTNDWNRKIFVLDNSWTALPLWEYSYIEHIQWNFFKIQKEVNKEYSLIQVTDNKLIYLATGTQNVKVIDPGLSVGKWLINDNFYVSVSSIKEKTIYDETWKKWYFETTILESKTRLKQVKMDGTIKTIAEWDWEGTVDFFGPYYSYYTSKEPSGWFWSLVDINTNKVIATGEQVCWFMDWHYLYKTNSKSSRYFMNKEWEKVCKCFDFKKYRSVNWNYIYREKKEDFFNKLHLYKKDSLKKIVNSKTWEKIWELFRAKFVDDNTISIWSINTETNNIEYKNYLIKSVFNTINMQKITIKDSSSRFEVSQDLNDANKVLINWVKYNKNLLKLKF
jgi:hypothetical protein